VCLEHPYILNSYFQDQLSTQVLDKTLDHRLYWRIILHKLCIIKINLCISNVKYKWMKFGRSILRKIVKLFPTVHVLLHFKANMHQNRFRLGLRRSAPSLQPRCGSLQRSLRPLAGIKGPTSKERGGARERKGRGMQGKESGWEGEGKGVEGTLCIYLNFP